MAGQRTPGPQCQLERSVRIEDGTMCRAEGARPGSVGLGQAGTSNPVRSGAPSGTANPKRTIRILGFDGSKVHDFLFHIAFSEIQWQDLVSDPTANVNPAVQKHRALNLASMLYDKFLQACSAGPNQATGFLAQQHDLQKKYLRESQVILQSIQQKNARNLVMLSELAFGAQAVKSIATAGVAIIGLMLTGPAVVTGAVVALGFDLTMEAVKQLGPSNDSNADTVVVGFKQTAATDAVDVAGEAQHVSLDATKEILQQTLSYPQKSSIYRSVVATGAQLDSLLTVLGYFSAGVTLYTEARDSFSSYDQMQTVRRSN
jgi:hypothetical protein